MYLKSIMIPYTSNYNDVIQFLNAIRYLGGRKVARFVQGPVNCSEGGGSHLDTSNEKLLNLGGPSYVSHNRLATPTNQEFGNLYP